MARNSLLRGNDASMELPVKLWRHVLIGLLVAAIPLNAFCAAAVVSIWGGARGTVVRKSDGTAWTWGANFAGKLGLGLSSTNLSRALVPNEVHGPGDAGFLNASTALMGGE